MKGRCQVCGRAFSLRADGLVRKHHRVPTYPFAPSPVCQGSLNRPKDESWVTAVDGKRYLADDPDRPWTEDEIDRGLPWKPREEGS